MTCMRVKGIPFSADDADVNEYFSDLTVIGLLMCTKNGKNTGDAYVEFASLVEVLKVRRHRIICLVSLSAAATRLNCGPGFVCGSVAGLFKKSWFTGQPVLGFMTARKRVVGGQSVSVRVDLG